MIAGQRLRVRPAGRPAELLLERDSEPFGELDMGRGSEVVLRLGGAEYEFTTGEGWDVTLRTPAGEPVAVHDDRRLRDDLVVFQGRAHPLDLPSKKRAGELRGPDGERIATLEMRHPDHGSVLLADMLADADDVLVAFAASIAYLSCGRPRTVRRFGQTHHPAGMTAGTFAAAIMMGGTGGFSGDSGGGGGGEGS